MTDSTPTLPPERIDLTLVDRYLANEGTPADRAAVEAWIASSPEHAAVVATLRAVLPGKQMDVRTTDRSRTSQGIARRPLQRTPRRSTGWMVWYTLAGIAASLVMFLAGRWTSRTTPITARTTTYTTRNGERAEVTLPDGSRAFLSVASRLEVPATFAAGDRSVRLTGEALFSVTHRTGHPFTVTAGGMTTQVLGTSFLVRHYSSDSSVTVAVRDGRVVVQRVVVAARQQVDVLVSGAVHLHPADAAAFSFANGVLDLRWMPLSRAIVELNRWYDVDIQLGDAALGSRLLQASFAAGSVGDLSAILGYTLDVRVVRTGRTLTLYAK